LDLLDLGNERVTKLGIKGALDTVCIVCVQYV
jgi:hypothetical protein